MANTLIPIADIPKNPELMAIAAILLIAPRMTKTETKHILRGEDPSKVAIKAAQRLAWNTVANTLKAADPAD